MGIKTAHRSCHAPNHSRANPNAPVDLFSDYDVILVVRDPHSFFEDRNWLAELGKVLVVFRDPIQLENVCERFSYITHSRRAPIDYSRALRRAVERIY